MITYFHDFHLGKTPFVLNKPRYYILIVIVLIGLFLRVWQFAEFHAFDYDQDLYSLIVKNILVDQHIRLIGQMTSVDGVFIGPLYYYLLVPFFALFKMDPLSAVIPSTLIGILTIISIYWVFSKLFNEKVGLIGSFIYATSISMAFFDRWIVPTQPTVLWSVWYLYLLFSMLEGNQKAIILVGILLGLIWHIHIAFLPLVLLIPIAILLARKKTFVPKYLFLGSFLFFFLISPLLIFELKHGFGQTRGFLQALSEERSQTSGANRLTMVLGGGSAALSRPFRFNGSFNLIIPTYLVFLSLLLFLIIRRLINKKQSFIVISWILIMLLSQQASKRATSDYYFNSMMILSILLNSLFLYFLSKSRIGLNFLYSILTLFFLINFVILAKMPSLNNGYKVKKNIISYIKKDSIKNKYSCYGINYIAGLGTDGGFRYLSWLYGLNVIQGAEDIPVYNVTIPYIGLSDEIKFGGLGLIPAKQVGKFNEKICRDTSRELKPLPSFY